MRQRIKLVWETSWLNQKLNFNYHNTGINSTDYITFILNTKENDNRSSKYCIKRDGQQTVITPY